MFTKAMSEYATLPKGVQTDTFLEHAASNLVTLRTQAKALAAEAHKGKGRSVTEDRIITTAAHLIDLIHRSLLSDFTKRFLLQSLVKETARDQTGRKKKR